MDRGHVEGLMGGSSSVSLRVVALLGAGLSLAAQPPARPQDPAAGPPPPVYRSGTSLVEVDAIVRDSRGRFVADLAREEFEIYENGVPQKIVTHALIQPAAAPGSLRTETAPPAGAAPSSATRAIPRVFVLMFDDAHMQPGAFKRLKDAAVQFLQRNFGEGDVGGVVVGGAMAGNRLTTSRETLLEAVRAAKPSREQSSRRMDLMDWPRISTEAEADRIVAGDAEILRIAVQRACTDDPSFCNRLDPAPQIMQKARLMTEQGRASAARTIGALQALAQGLDRVPGRKTIMLMSDGFLADESWPRLRQIVSAAAQSNVRIYSLDTRGTDIRGQAEHLTQSGMADPYGGPPIDTYNASSDAPNALAVDTGGVVIRHTNDFGRALDEIADDTSRYYVLGYSPATPAAAGAFQRIQVKVTRRGVAVRARRGYVAAARESATVAPREGLTSEPVSGPVSSNESFATLVRARSTEHVATLMPNVSGADRGSAAAGEPGAAQRGWESFQRGDVESARRDLAEAAARPGAPTWVGYALGQAAFALGRYNEAIAAWKVVRVAAPAFQPTYMDLADAYLQVGDAGAAVEILRSAEKQWPQDADVLNALGVSHMRRGAFDEAIATFTRATAALPPDGLACFNLAKAYELRYVRLRRYVSATRQWVSNEDDRRRAIEGYTKYLRIGGAFEASARDALTRLQWNSPR